jgi:excisionase family DNA binding protein
MNATDTTPRKVFKVKEVAALLGISRESVFALLRTGQLGSILIGKRGRRVTSRQLDAYIRSLEGRPPDGSAKGR